MSSNKQNQSIWDQYDEARKNSGKFLKLAPGERRMLQLNTSLIEIVDSEFEGKKTGGKSVNFVVLDPREPNVEKVLSISVRKAEGIMALLKAGKTLLDIQKIGSGKDSQYIAIPV